MIRPTSPERYYCQACDGKPDEEIGEMIHEPACPAYRKRLEDQVRSLQAKLDEYSGWAPDQFLRYQEEHRKLQQAHIELDNRRYVAELAADDLAKRLGAAEQEIKALRERLGVKVEGKVR